MAVRRVVTLEKFLGGIHTQPGLAMGLLPPDTGAGGAPLTQTAFDIENLAPLYESGGQRKERGYRLWVQLPDTSRPVRALYRYRPSSTAAMWLLVQGDTLYRWVDGTDGPEVVHTGLPTDGAVQFETAYNRCIVCDGINPPWRYEGTGGLTPLGGGAPTGARQAVFFADRLFVLSGTQDLGLLFHSEPGDIEAGYTDNFIPCDPQDGDRLVGVARFFIPGELLPMLFVGKQQSIGLILGDGTDDNPFHFAKINQTDGVLNPQSFAAFGQDLTYLTPRGVSSYKTDLQTANLSQRYLSSPIQQAFDALNRTTMANSVAWFDWRTSSLCYALPATGQIYPTTLWRLGVYQGTPTGWYKQRLAHPLTAVGLDGAGDVMLFGSSQGQVFAFDPTATAYHDAPIPSVYQTPYLDLGAPGQPKRLLEARLRLKGTPGSVLQVATSLDYGERPGRSQQFVLTAPPGPSYTWGGGAWTDDTTVYQWQGNLIHLRRWMPSGQFRSIQFRLSHASPNSEFEFYQLELVVEYL